MPPAVRSLLFVSESAILLRNVFFEIVKERKGTAMLATDILQDPAEISPEQVQQHVNGVITYIQEHIPNIIAFGVRVLVALVIFAVGRALIKWIRGRVHTSFEKRGADKGLAQFTDSFLKVALYLLLILVVAANLGIELSSITLLFASASVGISLALQGSLSNFMGGIFILLLKPFSVGDYIVEDTNHNEGTVMEIQMFYTRLNTIDNKTVVIPNSILANGSLTNVTAQNNRQLDLRVSVAYSADLKKAKALLTQLLAETPEVLKGEPVNVFVDELGESAVILGVRAWVKTTDYWPVRWALLERIKLTFDENEIEIPFNQLTLHVQDGNNHGGI